MSASFKYFRIPGIYYVDPNGGHWRDGLVVYCRLSGLETCVGPVVEQMPYVQLKHDKNVKWYAEIALNTPNPVSKHLLVF